MYEMFLSEMQCVFIYLKMEPAFMFSPESLRLLKMLVELLLIIDVDISYTVTQSLHIYTYLNGFPRW